MSLVQKSVKSAKGMQSLFLDLVPAMSGTPLGKTQPGGERTISEEAAAAMSETLAKRDAEVRATVAYVHLYMQFWMTCFMQHVLCQYVL